MSYIDELRERFLAAEQRFGRINEAGKEYRERLMGLMSRIEEEIRCRRDVERQQAQEIERLSGENEDLRTMLMSLLQAVESGDPNSLDDTLGEMDTKVAGLIGEGQGAPAPATEASEADAPMADDPVDEVDEAPQVPVFSAGAMMSAASAAKSDHVASSEVELTSEASSDEAFSEPGSENVAFSSLDDTAFPEDAAADDGLFADADEVAPAADTAGLETPEPSSSTGTTSDLAEFYGAESVSNEEIIPDYAHMAGGWDEFLDDDSATAAATGPEAVLGAPAESPLVSDEGGSIFDDAADSDDADEGSIKNLLDRVKTEVGGDDDQDIDDASNGGGATAAG